MRRFEFVVSVQTRNANVGLLACFTFKSFAAEGQSINVRLLLALTALFVFHTDLGVVIGI